MLTQIVILALAASALASEDKTSEEKAIGIDVVDAVMTKIRSSNIFPDDYEFLKRIAYVDSEFGRKEYTFRNGYYGGIWQVHESDFNATKDVTTNPPLKDKHDQIASHFTINWNQTNWHDLLKPIYSGLAMRLYISLLEAKNQPIPQTKALQAKYWNSYIRQNTSESTFITFVNLLETLIDAECRGKMDFLVLLDSSYSIGINDFNKSLEFVNDLFGSYSLDNVRMGFIQFSTTVEVRFGLDSGYNINEIRKLVQQTRYMAGNTHTNNGLLKSVEVFANATERPEVPKILAIFTDGQSNGPNRIENITDVKDFNITTFAIGIGQGINHNELNQLALGDTSHVFTLNDYETLKESFYRISHETCKISQLPKLNKTVYDSLVGNESRYYKYAFPTNESLRIILKTSVGQTKGYYSHFTKQPSSAIYDGILDTNGETFIPSPENMGVNEEAYVYLSMKGVDPINNYSILAMPRYGSSSSIIFPSISFILWAAITIVLLCH